MISIQELTDADGNVSYVVQLPGTDDFMSETEIRNMGSNLNLVAGDDTAYGDAVRQAMAAAGVDPADPVMLVGHSQGGMQAAALSGDPDFGYNVTHVVTAGSPVATSGIPDDVSVLSLENTGDVVPLLDGEQNPDLGPPHHGPGRRPLRQLRRRGRARTTRSRPTATSPTRSTPAATPRSPPRSGACDDFLAGDGRDRAVRDLQLPDPAG